MTILLITNSARGEAVCQAFYRSHHQPTILAISTVRSPGLVRMCSDVQIMDILDFPAILAYAQAKKPDMAFIAPDDPIGYGLADALQGIGIPCVGPTRSLARIESDKGFARELFAKYGIDASPKFRVFTRETDDEIAKFITDTLHGEYVVKYAGLRGGKGVKVGGEHLHSIPDAVTYARECIEEGGSVVVEEKLTGVEFSFFSLVSGEHVVDLPVVQDHKRAYDGDTGPNTGGMGTYTDSNHSLPFLCDDDVKEAARLNRAVAECLQKECGERYCGILYGGYMITSSGVKIIEYNARFGDPEALNLLTLLESDFCNICTAMIDATLTPSLVKCRNEATVCLYITPESYPDRKDERGMIVRVPSVIPDGISLYYGDVTEAEDGRILLGGSRSIGVVGCAETIHDAQQKALAFCKQVEGPIRYRTDIATEKLLAQKVAMADSLRYQ